MIIIAIMSVISRNNVKKTTLYDCRDWTLTKM